MTSGGFNANPPSARPPRPRDAHRAAVTMTQLIDEKLGVTIPPREVKRFLRENWRSVQALAHIIHGDI